MAYSDQVFDHETPTRARVRLLIAASYFVAGIFYFSWRLSVLNPDAPAFSGILLAAELYGFAIALLMIMISWRMYRREPGVLQGQPTVDVFVTLYNEPLHIVRRTIVAATRIHYPHQTWILDDGDRTDIKALAQELGCGYLVRQDNIGAKAGNINHGLQRTSGEFILLLDADHVPDPEMIDKLLGYFVDPKVAFVQTPQDYYNTDSFQHVDDPHSASIWHEQSYFHYVGQCGRDNWDAATLCGCSALLRRSALDEIGGFPIDTVTEDMHCAVRLQKLGYKTAYHPEPLAFGIAPSDMHGFLRQRLRWGEGNMQVCREEGLPFTRKLTWRQRLCYFCLSSTYLEAWQKLVYYVVPIYALLTGIMPMRTTFALFMLHFIPYIVLCWLYFEEFGRGYGRLFQTEKFSMARVGVGLVATLGLFRKTIRFRVSSKQLTGSHGWHVMGLQIGIAVCSVLALMLAVSRLWHDGGIFLAPGSIAILTVWCCVNLALVVAVLRQAGKCIRHAEEDFRFHFPLPVVLNLHNHATVVQGCSITSDRLEFMASADLNLSAGHTCEGWLYLPAGSMRFRAVLDTVDATTDGRVRVIACFQWQDNAARDGLELALISRRWLRFIANQSEKQLPPIDQWMHRMGFSVSAPVLTAIRPILFASHTEIPEHWQLGVVCQDQTQTNYLLLFSGAVTCVAVTGANTDSGYMIEPGVSCKIIFGAHCPSLAPEVGAGVKPMVYSLAAA